MALEAPATRFSQGSAELVYLCYMAQSGPVASPPSPRRAGVTLARARLSVN